MTRRTFLIFSAALLGMLCTTIPGPAAAQCLKCTTSINRTTGQLKCDVDPASAGYYECSCPCECQFACGQGVAATFEQLLDNPTQIPNEGVDLLGFEPERYSDRLVSGYASQALRSRIVYFADLFGIASLPDGSWRAYPLASAASFDVRSCGGQLIGTVARRHSEPHGSVGELLARLS
jgi:hypothetical protein